MMKLIRIYTSIMLIIFLFSVVPVIATDSSNNVTLPKVPSFQEGWKQVGQDAAKGIVNLINLFFMLVGVVAVVYGMYGGVDWIIGRRQHHPDQAESGWERITRAAFGIILVLTIYEVIVYLLTG